jgi:hypothetical protein
LTGGIPLHTPTNCPWGGCECEWKEVKSNFMYFIQCFTLTKENKETKSLSYFIELFLTEYKNQQKIIDSILVSKITVKGVCKYLFDYTLNESELDCLHSASLEWKKEIAMKGKGDLKTKKNAIQLVLNIIQKNKDVYAIFSEKWNLPEFYSVVMQPFIISPMINVPDIMCNTEILLQQNKISITNTITNTLIDKIIYSFHPFPILERYDPKTDIQYFIPLDSLTKFENFDKQTSILSFGYGERKCAGQHYAYQIITPFLKKYFESPQKFSPLQNHLYSGRVNDNRVNIYELLYMTFTMFQILISCFSEKLT